jgi:hypothetical protein
MVFIEALRGATLNDGVINIDPDALERLRNPPQEILSIDDPDVLLSLKPYFNVYLQDWDGWLAHSPRVLQSWIIPAHIGISRLKTRTYQSQRVLSTSYSQWIQERSP